MQPRKGDLVRDILWPEFGSGLVTTASKKRIRVLFDTGCRVYGDSHFPVGALMMVKTKAERMRDLGAAYEQFKANATKG